MSGDLDDLMESLVPGSGRSHGQAAEAPIVPAALQLERVSLLGSGRTGWVFRAYDPVLKREVAVKISRPDRGAEARTELLREAQRTARLAHPAVLAIYRVVAADGLLCVVRQLAPEGTLADRLGAWRRERVPSWSRQRQLQLMALVADAVAGAHDRAESHGDLHAGQIAIDDDDRPYVLDWGGLVAERGMFSGSPEVAAPEQLAGEPATASCDVFSLAALCHEVLGNRPLRSPRPREAVGPWLEAVRADRTPPEPIEGLDPALQRVITAALGHEPSTRPSARALADQLQAVVTGQSEKRRRQAEAATHLEHTRTLIDAFHTRERQLQEEHRVVAVQRAKVPSWAPADDKSPLWSAEDRVLHLLDLQAGTWAQAIEEAVRATGLDPDANDAHQYIAELWWERLQMAENRGYLGEAALAEHRIRTHDRGRLVSRMAATARLTVPAAGELLRVVRGPRAWSLQPVGSTPWVDQELKPGAYVVRWATGHTTSFELERHDHVVVDPELPTEPLEGFVWVPAGAFRMGGDPEAADSVEPCRPMVEGFWMAQHPVTAAQWQRWLATLPSADAEGVCPANDIAYGRRVPLWTVDDQGVVHRPAGWADEHPICGVGIEAAQAYASWLGTQLGRVVRLPTEEQWEKAARGADQRPYAWGSRFDPSFAHTHDSFHGGPQPGPIGAFATDASVYGVGDLSGGVREWTRSRAPGGRHVVRGGSWSDDARDARLASRRSLSGDQRDLRVGVRLVVEGP